MVSLTNIGLKLKPSEGPRVKVESDVVCEALMEELDSQIKDVARINREVEREKKKTANQADYSWLISTPPKSYQIPHMERLTLEQLASKVRPEDSGNVISEFRDIVEGIPRDVEELPKIMRFVIEKNYLERPIKDHQPESTLRWLTRSFSQLRTFTNPSSARIYPVTDIELEAAAPTRRLKSMSDFPRARDFNLPV